MEKRENEKQEEYGKTERENELADTTMEEENSIVKKRWFGRGIYGSKDVPIRLLDGFIGVTLLVVVGMIIFFAVRGGFWVTFDSQGGSPVEKQKIKHGQVVVKPEDPVRPGFLFEGWQDEEKEREWNFELHTVESSMTLKAKWSPALITVKFDLNGGTLDGSAKAEPKEILFGEKYGTLPVPEKEGNTFAGWRYSGGEITEDMQVLVSGEHILTAEWK